MKTFINSEELTEGLLYNEFMPKQANKRMWTLQCIALLPSKINTFFPMMEAKQYVKKSRKYLHFTDQENFSNNRFFKDKFYVW